MKVTINVECTPAEARSFFGLPDLEGLHEETLAGLKARLNETIAGLDAESVLKTWMPGGVKGFEDLQKSFWASFAGGDQGGGKGKSK